MIMCCIYQTVVDWYFFLYHDYVLHMSNSSILVLFLYHDYVLHMSNSSILVLFLYHDYVLHIHQKAVEW